MYNELVLIGTKQGHIVVRIDWIRSIADHEDGRTTIIYGETNDDARSLEVAWSSERVYRAIREANDVS